MSVLMTLSDVIDYHDEVREGNFLKCYFFLEILQQAVFNAGEETGWRPTFQSV